MLRFRSFVAHELRKGRVFLMGDAAHTVPPDRSEGHEPRHRRRALAQPGAAARSSPPARRRSSTAYPENALKRIWKAQHFSYWMTTMLHIAPDASEFDKRRGLGELALLTESRAAQQYLAESYTGWDYGVDDWR